MRSISMIVSILLTTATLSLAQTAFEKGNVAYLAKDIKQAVLNFERANMENPSNLELQTKLANCYRLLNKMDKAEKYYSIIIKNPATKDINYYWYWYAMVLKANKKYDEASKVLALFNNLDLSQKAQESCTFAKNNQNAQSAFFVAKETGVSSSMYDDYAPVLHRNGLLITSSRKVQHQKIAGGFSNPNTDNYIYRVKIDASGKLSNPTMVEDKNMFMPPSNVAPFDITVDEKKCISSINKFSDGVRHLRDVNLLGMDMEYGKMERLEDFPPGEYFSFATEGVSISFPSYASNGNTLYFAADGLPGGEGGFDIYVTYWKNGAWTTPQNLGPNVNTKGDEVSPHIANNGHLYFASDFHKGFGGYDVFRAKNWNGVWKDVRNLGPQVNSSFDDMYFVFDAVKRVGYFASNRNKNFSIYSAALKGDESLLLEVNQAEQEVTVNDPTKPNTSTIKKDKMNGVVTTQPITTNPTTSVVTTNPTTVTTTPVVTYPTATTTTVPTTTTTTVPTTTYPVTTAPTTVGANPTAGHNPPGTVPCAMNFYIGAIIDGTTKRALSDAAVYIKNQRTGEERKVKNPTNIYGEYSVILDPLTDYTIAVSKAGFKNLIFDVNTGTGGKKTLLSTRSMYGSATVQRDKWGNIDAMPRSAVATTTVPTPSRTELVNPPKASKYFSYENDGRRLPSHGYMIQAIVSSKLTTAQRFELSQYGNLISENRGDKTAYRVGVFVDENHLNNTLAAIRQTYKDAFKVPVSLNMAQVGGKIAASTQVVYPPEAAVNTTASPTSSEMAYTPAPKPAVEETPIIKENNYNSWANETKENPVVVAPQVPIIEKIGVEFKVQLGAFQKAESISFNNLNHLGFIEKEKRSNGLTYFYLSSFKTLDEARQARTKAKEAGVASPFIIAFKNGKKVKISAVTPNN